MAGNKRCKYIDQVNDNDDDDTLVINQFIQMSSTMMMTIESSLEYDEKCDQKDNNNQHLHKKDLRSSRREFNHQATKQLIERSYLASVPLFNDKQFHRMMRVSRTRFQRMIDDFGSSGIRFFTNTMKGASLEARLMLPLKTLAYGVASHTFSDFFSVSPEFSRQCCREFDDAFRKIYLMEYLRRPDKEDLKSIVHLHKKVHLRCCH